MEKLVSFKQVLAMAKSHCVVAVLSFMLGFVVFLALIASKIGSIMFTVIFTAIYVMAIYGTATQCAIQDKKPYSPLEPYPWKGLILPIGIWVVTAILLGLYKVAWTFMTIDGNLVTAAGMGCSFLLTVWTFMLDVFVALESGAMNGYGVVLLFVLPLVASGLGYYAGYRDFDLYEKMIGFVYEKKKK